MANEFDYEALFGPEFARISAQLSVLPAEVELMLLGVVDSMVFNVENFATNLNQTATLLSANGVESKVILDTLKRDKGWPSYGYITFWKNGSISRIYK